LASEDNCLVYVERGQNVSNALAEEIAGEFDNNIYPKITDVFAEPSDEDEIYRQIQITIRQI
jgi:hypothetical protein